MYPTLTAELQVRERKAQWLWTGFILAFFAIQACLWAVAITYTANDPSHAVVPDYDSKALAWDQQKAARAASDQLGWSAEVEVSHGQLATDWRPISLSLVDEQGQPVTGAEVSVAAFHRGRAGRRQTLSLAETTPGHYHGTIRVLYFGLWQFEGTADRQDDHYLIDVQVPVEAQR